MGAIDTLSPDQQLEAIYVGYYGRAADTGGFQFWTNQLSVAETTGGQSADVALTNVANSFAPQMETAALYPQLAGLTPPLSAGSPADVAAVTNFVNAVYMNVFNHALPTGDMFWINAILSNSVGLGVAVLGIENGAIGVDATTLHNKITVANSFTTQTSAAGLGNPPLPASYLPEAHSVVAATTSDSSTVQAQETAISTYITMINQPTINLTTGTDSGPAFTTSVANTIFNAPTGLNSMSVPTDTLQTSDVLTDTGANGSLSAQLIAGVQTPTMSGIATYNITASGAAVLSGVMTGVTTVNNVSSTAPLAVGTIAVPVQSLVNTVGVSNSSSALAVTLQASLLSGTSDAVTIMANNAGAAGASAIPTFASVAIGDGASNGFETWTVNSAGTTGATNFVQLSPIVTGGAASTATSIVSTGTAPLVLAADDGTSFSTVTSIDGSGGGGLSVAGAADNTTGAYAWGAAGVVTTDTVLTSFKGGTGTNFLDISNLTTSAAVNGVTIDDHVSTATNNTVVLSNSVVSGAVPLTHMTGVQVIGDTAVGAATINWANMPTSANTLEEFGKQTAAATITGAPSTFTLDIAGNDPLAAHFGVTVTAAAAASAGFTIDLGNANYVTAGAPPTSANQYDDLGPLTTTNYSAVTIESDGTPVAISTTGFTAAPTTVGNEIGGSITSDASTLTIQGSANLAIAGMTTLTGTNPSVIDKDTGVVLLNFTPTNLTNVTATATSGGLWMADHDTGNNGIVGVSITGSPTAANYLMGSQGNDNITGGNATDTIVTDGGKDTIIVAATHTNDVFDFFGSVGPSVAGTIPGTDAPGTGSSITSGADLSSAGFWNAAPPNTVPAAIAASTSADQSIIQTSTGTAAFILGTSATHDTLSFSIGAWGHTGAANLGLVNSDLTTTVAASTTPPITTIGNAAVLTGAQAVIVITGPTFTSAADLATKLKSGVESITFGGTLAAASTAHVLMAYNDPTGNAHIADVDLQTAAASNTGAGMSAIFASDMVQLTGVLDTNLSSFNFHLVA